MLAFRSMEDIPKARLPTHLVSPVTKLMRGIYAAHGAGYQPDDDGYVILVTPTDTDKSLAERLGTRWNESCFEGVSYDKASRLYHAVILRNNQFTLSILVPDEPWLDQAIRTRMLHEMEDEERTECINTQGGGAQP
ncbi:MAG: hypothetical protein CXR31_14775 [Geobacter sp.]|nr:MAG: hypothetical protein CXR31_14775 [Geobacter sp.]